MRSRHLVLLPLAFLASAALWQVSGSTVFADGCPPATCGIESVARAGSPIVTLRPYGAVAAYDLRTGRKRFSLPNGLASANGRWFVAVANRKRDSLLRRYDGSTGRLVDSRRLGPRLWPAAVSANGRRVVLADARSNRHRTAFELVDAARRRPVRRIHLRGSFSADAISNDGRRLFVIQYVGRSYRIRLFDAARDRLQPGTVRVKNETEPMRGYADHAVASPDGRWQLTLYIRPQAKEAFVHALDLRRAVAYCLDLPGEGNAGAMGLYSLALSPGGRTLFAANRALGTVAAVDLARLRVRVLARFRAFGGALPSYSNAVVAPDGKAVWFGDVHGLWLYRGSVRGPFRVGPVGGFGLTPDGRRLTVIRVGARMVQLDARTGKRL